MNGSGADEALKLANASIAAIARETRCIADVTMLFAPPPGPRHRIHVGTRDRPGSVWFSKPANAWVRSLRRGWLVLVEAGDDA